MAQSTTIRCPCSVTQGIMRTFPSWKMYLWAQRETPLCPLWSCEDHPGNHDLGSDEKMKQNMGT